MKKLRIIIFNVEHGFSALVISPNGYGLLYDCGKADRFSPIEFIRRNESLVGFKGFSLAEFVVSHPHDDHIEDISRLTSYLKPAILYCEKFDWEEIKTSDNKEEYENLDAYSDWQETYNLEVVEEPDWGMDLHFGPSLTPEQAKNLPGNFVNNSSIPLFIAYKDWKIALTGDLEKEALLELLKLKEFKDRIADTNFFIAPHHGHSSGYCKEIYEVMGKPNVNIVSVHSKDEHVDPAYSSTANATGVQLNGETRYMVTTRNDGSIIIEITEDGKALFDTEQFDDNLVKETTRRGIW